MPNDPPHSSRRGGLSKEDVGSSHRGKITKHRICKYVGIISQSNITFSHDCDKCIFLLCSSYHKKREAEWLSYSIYKQKRRNYDHPLDTIKWEREGGLRSQAYFCLKEVRPALFVYVTPGMGGLNFDSSNNNNDINDDDDDSSQGGADANEEDKEKAVEEEKATKEEK